MGSAVGKVRIHFWYVQETFLPGVQTESGIQQSCYCTAEHTDLRETGNSYLRQNLTLGHIFVMRLQEDHTSLNDMTRHDIFVKCNWVDTRWQQYGTHLYTHNTQNNTMKHKTQNGRYITIRIRNKQD